MAYIACVRTSSFGHDVMPPAFTFGVIGPNSSCYTIDGHGRGDSQCAHQLGPARWWSLALELRFTVPRFGCEHQKAMVGSPSPPADSATPAGPPGCHGKLDTRVHSRARFSSRNLKLGCTGLAWEPGLRSDTLCADALTFRLRRNRGPMSRAPPNKTSVQKLTAVPQVTQGTEKKGAVGRAAACHSVAGDAPQISQNSLKSWIWLQSDCQHLSA